MLPSPLHRALGIQHALHLQRAPGTAPVSPAEELPVASGCHSGRLQLQTPGVGGGEQSTKGRGAQRLKGGASKSNCGELWDR